MDSSWLTPTVLFCFLNLIIISIFINAYYSTKSHKTQLAQHDSPQLNRSSSLFARVKSISFSKKYFDPNFQPQTDDIHVTQEVVSEEKLSVSDAEEKLSISEEPVKTVPSEQEEKKEQLKTSTTSVKERKKNKLSGKREAAVVKTVSFKGDEQVDAKADDFINRFKQQLKLQRIDSIKRYTQMLTGSGGSGASSAN